MKHFNIKFYNVYGAVIYDDTILAPNAFRALDSARYVYFKSFPNIRASTMERGIDKFSVEAAK